MVENTMLRTPEPQALGSKSRPYTLKPHGLTSPQALVRHSCIQGAGHQWYCSCSLLPYPLGPHGLQIHPWDSSGPFPYKFAFCGPPMFGAIEPLALSQWMNYHRFHMGLDYFIFYDAGEP